MPCLSVIEIPWAKPILKAHHSAFYFEHSLGLSNQALLGFEKAALLYRSVQLQHEESTGLVSSADFVWQENKRLIKTRTLVFEGATSLGSTVFQIGRSWYGSARILLIRIK